MTQKMKIVFEWVENILGKGENAGNEYVFKSLLLQGPLKLYGKEIRNGLNVL